MDNATDSGTDLSENRSSFALQFGVTLGVFTLIGIIIIASYFFYSRKHMPVDPSQHGSSVTDDQDSVIVELGLDEATINSYPKLLYSQAKIDKGDSIGRSCSICLADYKEGEMVRLMPECDHIFHLKCIDPWLRLHATCPVCRRSFPAPISTTSNEIICLRMQREFFNISVRP
ncbi:putative RING-H2 finger protein ATL71 [Tripterygium wilfordii]|uniref:RING-type E3 ubiquitin transferase n=1 Tax=Tripterygium wilfordii TaxID=458696 RepID=A0A7J7C5G7_TRIWF|nr:RING-H2 finger protein ATL70-like [Tripterygium wilfordii]KAF5729389.1 putative RING-H2 finger protein ATL71 [Tripterygium wilfordii]